MKIKIRIKRKARVVMTILIIAGVTVVGGIQKDTTPVGLAEVVEKQESEDIELAKEIPVEIISVEEKVLEASKATPEGEQEITEVQTKEVAKVEEVTRLEEEETVKKPRTKEDNEKPTRGGSTRKLLGTFNASAYDLSFQSCGKASEHPLYGITANGDSLVGQTREQAMTIAADTRVIPMGSEVYIEFSERGYERFNGVYTVRDRGGAIKGNKIDVFMGDFNQYAPSKEALEFGRMNVKVYIK